MQQQPMSEKSHTSSSSADFGAFVEAGSDSNQVDNDDAKLNGSSQQGQMEGAGKTQLVPHGRALDGRLENGTGNLNSVADSPERHLSLVVGKHEQQQPNQHVASSVAPDQHSHDQDAADVSGEDPNEWGEWGQSQSLSSFSPMEATFRPNDQQTEQRSPSPFQSLPPFRGQQSQPSKAQQPAVGPNSQIDWDAWLLNSNPSSTGPSQRSRVNTSSRFISASTADKTSTSSPGTSSRDSRTAPNSDANLLDVSRSDAFDTLLPPGFTLPPPPSASDIPDPPSHHQGNSLSRPSNRQADHTASRDLLADDDHAFASFDTSQDFFQAFSNATSLSDNKVAQMGPPSPPIIDLRETERKLRAREEGGERSQQEDDFFSSFEKSPSELMRSVGRNSSFRYNPSLEGENLENLGEAQSSPMEVSRATRGSTSEIEGNYFDGETGSASNPSISRNGSGSGSWSGSLRKTWSSLKGSLPSASDFLVMEDGEGGEWNPSTSPVQSQTAGLAEKVSNGPALDRNDINLPTTSSRPDSRSPRFQAQDASRTSTPIKKPVQQLAHASDYNGDLRISGRKISTHHAPVSGAPGFSYESAPRWNTGDWTLDDSPPASSSKFADQSAPSFTSSTRSDKQPRPRTREMKVTLSDRRDETSEVITQFHSSRIQSNLPPRLQLGRNWKLLYSMDQHGISLSTMYQKINLALDPSKARRTGNEHDKSGLMLGASKEAMASLGLESNGSGSNSSNVFGRTRVGGGLDLKDAGLVIAVKDGDENVFGAFVNERLRPQSSYYGSGECFLWKTVSSAESDQADVVTYKWTGKNDYMILTESHYISFGGGDSRYGLWLDKSFEKGVSSKSPAFDNEALCNDLTFRDELDSHKCKKGQAKGKNEQEQEFECFGLEVWAVGID